MPAKLLRSRRFLPLFLAQTLGALNDNMFKNALVVLVIFSAAGGGPAMVAAAGGVFILPYALFSALAGQLADKYDKSRLIRLTKLCEVALMVLAALGFLTGSLALLFAVLFGLGVQATFFGPLKYGILPDHLGERELVDGNARIEAGTFGGILAGTIAGGAIILLPHGAELVSVAGLLVAVAGAVAGFAVPPARAASRGLVIGWNPWRQTIDLIAQARTRRGVWLAIRGLSWFWTVGATMLTEFPVLARDRFAADGHVVTLLLAMFATGVGVGSWLVARLLQGEVSARHVPFAALLLSVFIADFAWVCAGVSPATGWTGVGAMLQAPRAWRALADLFLIAMCGGAFSVPLYAILQEWSDPARRARVIAANNVLNAGFIVLGAVAIAVLDAAGVSAPGVLAITAGLNLVVAAMICRLLPQEVLRSAMRWYFSAFHGVELRGLENVAAAGERVVIVANHLGFADFCLLAAFLPGQPTFAVSLQMTRTWWARPFLAAVEVFAVDLANPFAARAMVRAVQSGRRLVIFPEGRLTDTGSLMKVYEGAGMVADRAAATILPVRIDGLHFSRLSRTRGKPWLRWFPRLTMTILPPATLQVPDGLPGRVRRRAVGAALQDVMSHAAFAATPTGTSLFAALLAARSR
jgi:acyl-[acyl-carrier-protein]-phospholipid O-acyltransferase/long-chain-fatty-acid--[acyl-carrier-protein] ligase